MTTIPTPAVAMIDQCAASLRDLCAVEHVDIADPKILDAMETVVSVISAVLEGAESALAASVALAAFAVLIRAARETA